MFNILLVEDDYSLAKLIAKKLENNGYSVVLALNGNSALAKMDAEKIDLVITDIMMPIMDGNELLKEIRNYSPNLPVIMLTALEGIDSKRKSFNYGADDYITKPINYEELMLRIESLLRRANLVSKKTISYGDIELDYNSRSVLIKKRDVYFTKTEFMILFMLFSHIGRVYSREEIFEEIWNYESNSSERTVDVHIRKIREKIESSNIKITTIRGLGYKVDLL